MKFITLSFISIIMLVSSSTTNSEVTPAKDLIETIKVYFLYGSKPTKDYKSEESKWFGGKHGGHVGIATEDDKIVSFLPTGQTHVFSKDKKMKSRFVTTSEKGFWEILGGNESKVKKTIVHIPVTSKQKGKIDSIHQEYLEGAPYDYAFFGMRCGAATYEILGQIDIVKSHSNSKTWKKIFYPKKLRTTILKQAQRNDWIIEKIEGSTTRNWEQDKSKLN